MNHPDWALKFKAKNTELRCIRCKYYHYNITSKYDSIKKRSKKITLYFFLLKFFLYYITFYAIKYNFFVLFFWILNTLYLFL